MQYLSCYQGYCRHGGAEKVDVCAGTWRRRWWNWWETCMCLNELRFVLRLWVLTALWLPDLAGEMMTIPKTLLNIAIVCADVLQKQIHLWSCLITDGQPTSILTEYNDRHLRNNPQEKVWECADVRFHFFVFVFKSLSVIFHHHLVYL